MSRHLLSILLFLPLLAALVVMFTPRQYLRTLRGFSVGVMVVEFLLSLRLLFDRRLDAVDWSSAGYKFVEAHSWVDSLGIQYKVGVDGISLWLVLLTTALTPIALFSSWQSIDTKIKEFALAFLLLECGMIGAFVSLDLFLFYVFWELMLVPMYLIIGIWGGKDRVYAAVKFFIFTMVGSVLMLVALLYLVSQYHGLSGNYSFDLAELSRVQLPPSVQYLCFAAFALAFAIKVPMFPFHTWLPDAHVQAPTGGSVILAAVLLKMGTYGFLRFAMPLFPFASHILGPTLAVLAVIGIIYGAYCAWVQKDVKKLVAYSSVSHLGFVMLGLFSLTTQGISGAILQMVSHGVSTGALFLLVGIIYERRHTRDLEAFGGLAKVMPFYAVIFVIVTLSSIGLPGTNGFIGEFMVLSGAFSSVRLPWGRIFAAFAATGVVLAAIYMLHAVLKMFWGPLDKPENRGLPDLTRREIIALAPLVVLIFWIGLYPSMFLSRMEPSVNAFIATYEQGLQATSELREPRLTPARGGDGAESGRPEIRVVAPGGAQ
jgi:NADH-quinone oxidoreductase subunit M